MYALVFVSNIEGVALNTKLGKVKRNGKVTSCICQRPLMHGQTYMQIDVPYCVVHVSEIVGARRIMRSVGYDEECRIGVSASCPYCRVHEAPRRLHTAQNNLRHCCHIMCSGKAELSALTPPSVAIDERFCIPCAGSAQRALRCQTR